MKYAEGNRMSSKDFQMKIDEIPTTNEAESRFGGGGSTHCQMRRAARGAA